MIKVLRSQHFWYIALIFGACCTLLYSNFLSFLDAPGVFSRAGLTSYTLENVFFLLPVIYANSIFRLKGGITALALTGLAMLPRAIFLSHDPVAAVLVSSGVLVTGSVITLSFFMYDRNIAQREYAHAALRNLVDTLPVPIFAVNKLHKVTQWNTAIESLTGIARGEMIGSDRQWKAFYAEKRPVMADLITDGATDSEIEANYPGISSPSPLIKGAYAAENFFPALGKTGRWLYFTASPIRGSKGDISGAVETLMDITDRKDAEKAVTESGKSYRNLFESAMDAIWVHDLSGNITAVNAATSRFTGYSMEELTNFNVKVFLDEKSLLLAREIKKSLMQGRDVAMPYEQTMYKKDGTRALCMITTNQIIADGKLVAFQNIGRDVTEERRLYENLRYYLEQITRAQEEERKRIARELHDSTLQTLIALMHQLEFELNKANLPVDNTRVLWGFHDQLKEVVQEVRRFSRDLRPSILDDLGLQPALEWLTQELKKNYSIETKLVVSGQRRRLSPEAELLLFRIVQEALNNIAKHAQAGNAEVGIEFAQGRVLVEVSDDGRGFEVPDKPGDLPRSGKLGLAGLAERAQLLGGSLQIISAPGRGTKIRVDAFA